MPSGRTVLLLRRLSTGDNKLKTITLNQNTTKESALLSIPVSSQKDLGLPKRLSTFGANNIVVTQLTRTFSDSKITMASSSTDTADKEKPKHTNRLISEKSPYLLQHAHNPVQWYPWCQEAINKAKEENKLIFLSVGYSTCHWCHVMEKESFESEDVAKVMNEHFINIKVDREERPDIDRVYMLFIMATSGGGGWPMSVFLTPDLRPVTGGTYFPPEDKWGRPGFKTILLSLAKKWKDNQRQFEEASNNIMEALQKISLLESDTTNSIPNDTTWEKCVHKYKTIYEPEFGGFGLAPKFPQASVFNFLFHYYARDKHHPEGKKCLDMCLHTLKKIACGGIHDHVSSGFARYSVDNDWHVPHFEKMLYDQAQLIVAYTDAFLATKDKFYADVVEDIVKYVKRDLRHESGGFYSAEDADSYPEFGALHKKEGAFCTWEYKELKSLLDGKVINSNRYLDVFCDYFSVQEDGNISPESDPHNELTNKNVLIIYGNKEKTAEKFGLTMETFDRVISESIDILYEERQKRPRPHLDTKMLCSWNGLMIAGLAQAGQGLGEKDYVTDAIETAEFIKKYLYNNTTNTLLHSCYRAEDGSVGQTDGTVDIYRACHQPGESLRHIVSGCARLANGEYLHRHNQVARIIHQQLAVRYGLVEVELPYYREVPIQGFLDDYAFLIKGLLDLYEASLDYRWLQWARELQQKQNELFWDSNGGGYFTCSDKDSSVVLRLKEDQDGAEPSGNSVSCHNLLRLAAYADKSAAPEGGELERDMAKKILQAFANRLMNSPTSLPEMMSALMFYNDSPTQVLIAGGFTDPRTLALVRVVRSRLLPGRVLCVADPSAESPAGMSDILLSRIRSVGDVPTAYVCRRYACSLPVTDVKQLENLLDEPTVLTAAKK